MNLFQNFSKLQEKDYLTLANAASGVGGIALAVAGSVFAPLYVIPALFFDWADGKLARATNRGHGTNLGKELDSLADTVSFTVAPAVLAIMTAPFFAFEVLCAAIFVCAGITRLALFNVQREQGVFFGLPTPAAAVAALLVSAFVPAWSWLALLVLAFLMLAGFRFGKPKL